MELAKHQGLGLVALSCGGHWALGTPVAVGHQGYHQWALLLELLLPTISIWSCFPAPAMPRAHFSPNSDAQLPILLLIIVFARQGLYL